MSMGTFHVAQTFLSAVPQVFQPARRVGNSNGCLAADALPTRKSAKRQVGKPALRMGESLMSFVAQTFLSAVPQVFQPAGRVGNSNGCLAADALPDGKGLNIQYPTRNVQFPTGERMEDQSRFAEQAVFPSSLDIPCSILDISPFSILHLLQELKLPCKNQNRVKEKNITL